MLPLLTLPLPPKLPKPPKLSNRIRPIDRTRKLSPNADRSSSKRRSHLKIGKKNPAPKSWEGYQSGCIYHYILLRFASTIRTFCVFCQKKSRSWELGLFSLGAHRLQRCSDFFLEFSGISFDRATQLQSWQGGYINASAPFQFQTSVAPGRA